MRRSAALYETEGITCELCGKITPSQYWLVPQDGREMKFCNAECHTVYVQYWKPRYRDAQ